MSADSCADLCAMIPILLEKGFIEEGGSLSFRHNGKIYITPHPSGGRGISSVKVEDILEISENALEGQNELHRELPLHRALYAARPEINALIHITSPAVNAVSCTGRTVYPLLDDMAQIVGTSMKSTPEDGGAKGLRKAVKAFRQRNALFIEDKGSLCGGPSLDEAYAVCQVCEKACKAFIESSFIGGFHRINPVESWIMRTVYLKKYSRRDIKNR